MADKKTVYDLAADELNKDIEKYNKIIKDNTKATASTLAPAAVYGAGTGALILSKKKITKKIEEIENKIKELSSKRKKTDEDNAKIKDLDKALTKFKKLDTTITAIIPATAAATISSAGVGLAKTKSNRNTINKIKVRRNNVIKDKENLDALSKKAKDYSAKKAMYESVTLEDAMIYITDYINEGTHVVDGKKVRGTTARVALAKAKMLDNASSKGLLSKYQKHVYLDDADKLSKGVDIKKVNKYKDAVNSPVNDELVDSFNKHGLNNKKGPVVFDGKKDTLVQDKHRAKKVMNAAKAFNNFTKASGDLRGDIDKLREAKKRYSKEVQPEIKSHEERLPGEYKRLADEVKEQGRGAAGSHVAAKLRAMKKI